MKRRAFLEITSLGLAALVPAHSAWAGDPLSPTDPGAVSLGFSIDHTQVDPLKWQKKAIESNGEQRCARCAHFRPIEGGRGECVIFYFRTVPENGWCNAWTAP